MPCSKYLFSIHVLFIAHADICVMHKQNSIKHTGKLLFISDDTKCLQDVQNQADCIKSVAETVGNYEFI